MTDQRTDSTKDQLGEPERKRIRISSEPPWLSHQHKEDLFAPEGQRAGNKRQRLETEGGGERKGKGLSVLEDKGLPLDRAETDLAHRKMAAYKSKRGNPKSGWDV